MSWVFAPQSDAHPDGAAIPAHLLDAHIAEMFHLTPDTLDACDATRLYHWYLLRLAEDRAREVKRKMDGKGETLDEHDQAWLREWFEYVPDQKPGAADIRAFKGT